MQRAFSTFEIKSFDEEQRIVEGIASTPELDRGGDEMDPKGAQFVLPMPFKWQHKSAVGEVFSAVVTSAGIFIKAKLPKIDEPGLLKDQVDYAWQSIKFNLTRGLSIGWRPLEAKRNAQSGGLKVAKWEWFETSAVDVPMNARTTISLIKSLATDSAASGTESRGDHTPGVSGTVRAVKVRQANSVKKTITEQIASFKATLVAKVEERDAIMQKSADEGVTLDAEQTEQYETLKAEIKNLTTHIGRLEDLEAENVKAAKEVTGKTKEDGTATRDITRVISVKEPTLPPGYAFSRAILCKAASFMELQRGHFVSAVDIAKKEYPSNESVHQYLMHQKTAVVGGTTTDANFAAALLANAQTLENDFLEYLRPRTIIGKFGTNGIPSLRRVPFNVKIQSQTSGASASWVGEGKAKPVTKFNTTSTTLLFTKIAAIAVITDELARFSSPGAEGVVRDELARAVIERMDTDFVDPAKAVSAGVNPASITNGVTALSSAGVSAANALTDLQNLLNPFILANYDVSDLVLIMPNSLALAISLMENSLGQKSFSDMTLNGGFLRGIPVITSQYAASGASYGNMVIAVSAGNIALADDGRVNVDASREASIEMSDAPAGDATAGTGASMTSMFQTNSLALRAEREINWKKLRSNAVVFMDDVNWGSIGSPV